MQHTSPEQVAQNMAATLSAPAVDASFYAAGASIVTPLSPEKHRMSRGASVDENFGETESASAEALDETQYTPDAAVDVPVRIVPQLVKELHATPPMLQRLHLRLFVDRLDDFLTYCGGDA